MGAHPLLASSATTATEKAIGLNELVNLPTWWDCRRMGAELELSGLTVWSRNTDRPKWCTLAEHDVPNCLRSKTSFRGVLSCASVPAAVHQAVHAGPGGVGGGIDVQLQGVARLAPGGACLESATAGHDDGDLVVIRADVRFHGSAPALRDLCNQAPMTVQERITRRWWWAPMPPGRFSTCGGAPGGDTLGTQAGAQGGAVAICI